MPPRVCPRCHHTNPEIAVFCYYDGAELAPAHGGPFVFGRLGREFAFPTGRRCQTFDELACGCQDEWPVARELLGQGAFREFFASTGRLDLARAAEEAMAQADADIGLTNFLNSLPVTPGEGPRLDLHPRRLVLGNVLAGDTRMLDLTISNKGKGLLQGTLSIVDGGTWLKLAGSDGDGRCSLRTASDQQIALQVDTHGLEAAKTYGAKLKVVTNGGIVEVPVGLNLLARPFPHPPLKGVRTPRELAVKMRNQPKAAVPLLESGEIARWFSSNGWQYPVRATPGKGVAGVQQFFECMGLSKPPVVRLSASDVKLTCKYPEPARGQVSLLTSSKKWVYAQVESDAPWLRVLHPNIAGPQQATISFLVDPRQIPGHVSAIAKLLVTANAGQTLSLQVRTDVRGAPGPPGGRLLQPMLVMALTLLVVRLFAIPVVDLFARSTAVGMALGRPAPADALALALGSWTGDFGDLYVRSFVNVVALSTWWLGAAAGLLLVRQRGGTLGDLPWGLLAGAVAGLIGGASLASLVLTGDLLPGWLWLQHEGGLVTGPGAIIPWLLLVLLSWTLQGAVLGLVLELLGSWGRLIVTPLRYGLARLCRFCGLRGAAAYFAMS